MTERKPDTAHEWVDPDDAPEWTDEMFDMAEFSVGGKVIRAATGVLTRDGMRPIAGRRQEVTLRLPPKVIAHFKSGGPGWPMRIEAVLEDHVAAADRQQPRSSAVAETRSGYSTTKRNPKKK